MQEFIGLMGSVCFAISSWPQAYLSIKTKSAHGITWSFILLWLSGSVFSTIYAVSNDKLVLLPNFICGGVGIFITGVVKVSEVLKERQNHG